MPQFARLALFIDGDNIAAQHAPEILRHAETHGPVPLRRVYGNAELVKDWPNVPGLRMVHASGKNAADFVLTIDAMEAALEAQFPALMIVSDDGGFSHLALRLRERGLTVLGLGTPKAPACLRAACTTFATLDTEKPVEKPSDRPAEKPLPPPHDQICEILRKHGPMPLTTLSSTLRTTRNLTVTSLGAATWRAFLGKSPLYRLDPKGPTARVHLT